MSELDREARVSEPEDRWTAAGSGHRRDDGAGAVEQLRRRDEMLQVLFWLEGEGFSSDMTATGIRRFLNWPPERIAAGLDDLVRSGFAVADDERDRYRLTREGRQEGGRRFLEEFAPLLSRDTHHGSECRDPDCECHTSPLGAAACRANA